MSVEPLLLLRIGGQLMEAEDARVGSIVHTLSHKKVSKCKYLKN